MSTIHHLATGDLIACLLAIILIAALLPLAIHNLLDRWGDRHAQTRRAAMTASASLPIIIAAIIIA